VDGDEAWDKFHGRSPSVAADPSFIAGRVIRILQKVSRDRDPDEITQVVQIPGQKAPAARRDRCSLTVITGGVPGTVFTVQTELVIGRGQEAAARIDDSGLSRKHAKVFRKGEGWFVEDLGSTNGTFVGGQQVAGPRSLRDGDRIQMGKNLLVRVSLQDDLEHEVTKNIYEQAVRDALTGLHNRRYLDERLKSEVAFALRHGSPISVLIIDIDHFKRVNDGHGHPGGDLVLRAIGELLLKMVRAEDLAARYGGEEFCILARGADDTGAYILAERLRTQIRKLGITYEGRSIQITASIGLATMRTGASYPSAEALLAAADEALYRAKETGRDRCIVATSNSMRPPPPKG
jgi:diguanylate cyclase (GGDEF)-like protein